LKKALFGKYEKIIEKNYMKKFFDQKIKKIRARARSLKRVPVSMLAQDSPR
jgi:hypothetical protein